MPKTIKLERLLTIKNGKNYDELKTSGRVPVYGSGGRMGFVERPLYEGESILLPRKGSLRNITYVNEAFWTVDTMYYGIVDTTLANPYYLYQYLKLLDLSGLDSGSTVPSMTMGAYYDINIELPDIPIQNSISEVIRSIDDKMSISNKIITELESLAHMLYEYWFVQFDFPDVNGQPYKSSGGKMRYNEKLKREIPEDWVNLTLSDIVSRTGTGLNPRDHFTLGSGENFYVTIKNIDKKGVHLDNRCDKIDDNSLRIINNRSDLKPGDVLFTSIEPVGITYLLHETPTNWNINESVFTIRPNYQKVTPEYLYMLLSSKEMRAFTKNVSAGSIHKGVRHGILRTFNLPYFDKNIIDKFTDVVKPILEKINTLNKENQNNLALRDWLLPLLINGQAKVDQRPE